MSFLTGIIPTIFVLGIVIMVHEFGHFLACRMTKVRVEKFSIGFGPELFHWQGRETRYAVSLIPFGGFIKPAGESVSELEGAQPKDGDYLAAPLWARIYIVSAGVIMNYLLAYALFVVIFMIGFPVLGTVVGDFVDGYPAAESGLLEGDRIVQVNTKPVRNWLELTDALQSSQGPKIDLMVERGTEAEGMRILPIAVYPTTTEFDNLFGEKVQGRKIGIMPDAEVVEHTQYGFFASFGEAARQSFHLTIMTHKALFYLVIGKLSMKNIAGPVGIVSMAGDAAKRGITSLLTLTATLCINLAVINLLPIPALDGGHLLFLLIEAVRRKQVSLKIQERFTQVGFTLLIALMFFVIYNDLVNIEAFEKVKGLFAGR